MTVYELIRTLQLYPQNAEVVLYHSPSAHTPSSFKLKRENGFVKIHIHPEPES